VERLLVNEEDTIIRVDVADLLLHGIGPKGGGIAVRTCVLLRVPGVADLIQINSVNVSVGSEKGVGVGLSEAERSRELVIS
jgi:hypothetical protein